jgi:membrane glycosyltransferase
MLVVLMLLLHRVIAGCLQSNRRDYNISDQTITSRQVAVYCLLAFVTKAVCRLLQSVVLLLPAQGYCSISSTPICTCCTPFLTIPSTSDRFIRMLVCRRLCSKIRTVCCLRPIVVLFCLHRVMQHFQYTYLHMLHTVSDHTIDLRQVSKRLLVCR